MEDMSSPHVLVVDDDAPIRSLIAKVLERAGITVRLAKDGAEALQLFNDQRFDVIVLDLMMPTLSGYEVLDYLESRLDAHTAVIVVTAAGDADVVRLQGRRVHSILRKPFDIGVIADVVSAVAREMAEAHESSDRASGTNVTVIEFKR
jgi:DNA-binding response OmpR family regulator